MAQVKVLAVLLAALQVTQDQAVTGQALGGVYVDEAFFLGGVGKPKLLKAFNPHIFFNDQDVHLETAANLVPSGKVPYLTSSGLAGLLPAPADQ